MKFNLLLQLNVFYICGIHAVIILNILNKEGNKKLVGLLENTPCLDKVKQKNTRI